MKSGMAQDIHVDQRGRNPFSGSYLLRSRRLGCPHERPPLPRRVDQEKTLAHILEGAGSHFD